MRITERCGVSLERLSIQYTVTNEGNLTHHIEKDCETLSGRKVRIASEVSSV
jgi:hypothetical protein